MSARIHSTAVIDPVAILADDVTVGPYAVIEGPVTLGAGCVVRARSHLLGPLIAGTNNDFGSGAVIGERPQHQKYPDGGQLIIGSGNVFRECVTVHRSTPHSDATRIGDRNYFMVQAHVAHDCLIGNDSTFVNGTALGGHVVVEDRVFVSANVGVQQFCRLGTLAMISGGASVTMGVPPYAIIFDRNELCGANVIGMRRAGMTAAEISAVRQAYRILLHSGLLLRDAVDRLQAELGHFDAVQLLVKFFSTTVRPMFSSRDHRQRQLRTDEAA
jgi:UDP-N-acetylglucosamine acyltransferase